MFRDRRDAGRRLAHELIRYRLDDPVVIGLPRGGVVVAAAVAEQLHAPLDVLVVRKLGVPWWPELAFGAIAEGGVCHLNAELVAEAGITTGDVDAVIARETIELQRRVRVYRRDASALSVDGRAVIVVDDGLATGYTARAAIDALRRHGPRRVVLAAPVASASAIEAIGRVPDAMLVLLRPGLFLSVGDHYEDFTQTSDEDVIRLLRSAAALPGHAPRAAPLGP